ncbi:hypothetical protein LTR84_006399 [Exophiala bonariae]|uniref:MIND kinetochore complex component Mtw1 n=1 Tax=Exophiala bonariae TaxID=1690606 RepID=A0AAV9N3V9_9EURO|nr:hypothetical protein LTR84_006399 [Exophiala bonariae]
MTMSDPVQTSTALLTEHLQYTPLSLIDDIINSVNNFVYQGVGSLEIGLLSTPPERLGFKAVKHDDTDGTSQEDFPEAKQEIEEGLHQLETLLNSTVDKNFDKFEIYVLRNILSVPADLGISYPPPENGPTAESVQLLRQQLAASRAVSRALLEEQTRNEAILGQLRGIVGSTPGASNSLSFLTTAAPLVQQTLTTNTNFVLSQLPAIRNLLNELRPKLAALREAKGLLQADTAKEELRAERRQYIEQRTRMHLERNGQTLGEESAMVSGKRVDPEEVQALEKVASIFEPT